MVRLPLTGFLTFFTAFALGLAAFFFLAAAAFFAGFLVLRSFAPVALALAVVFLLTDVVARAYATGETLKLRVTWSDDGFRRQ